MRIFHYLRSVHKEDGGIVRAVVDHSTIMLDNLNEVTFVTFRPRDLPDDWQALNSALFKQLVIRRIMFSEVMGVILQFYRIYKEMKRADIVYLHELWNLENIILSYLARWAGKPYIVPVYGMLDSWATKQKSLKKKLFHRILGRIFLENARFLQCVSKTEFEQAKNWAPKASWTILPYLVKIKIADSAKFGVTVSKHQDSKDQQSRTRFLFISRLHPKKGLELLLQAAGQLKVMGYPFDIIIAGSGESEYVQKLKSIVVETNIVERCQFVGIKFGREKEDLFDDVDALVLPTHSDNFGLILVEAMGFGLPVITTRNVGIWEALSKGGAIIIDGTIEKLTLAMAEFIELTVEQRQMIGMSSIVWAKQVTEVQRLYQSYLDMHKVALRPKTSPEILTTKIL